MKKYFIPFLVLGTTLLYSCAKEEVTSDTDSSSSVEKVKMEFKAGIDAMSRTVLTENNKVEWEADDAISLFDSDSNNKFTTSTSGPSVTFTGTVQDNLGTYYALYPYNEKATISGSEITTTLSAEQTALEGSFAKMLNPSVAKSGTDKSLNFKNACAVVKFTLGTGVTNVVKAMFRGNDGESLAGTLNINVSGNAPVTTVETGEGTGVTLTSNEGFVTGTDYYFVVAPLELKKGITLVLYDSNGKEWKRRGGNPVKLTAGHILDLGTITPDEFKEIVHISTADDLVNWSGSSNKLTTDVVLDADIYMDGKTWTPVGSSMTAGEGYSGNFDGNGKTIHNLNINNVSGNVGFFGGLAEGGKVHDLKFSDATITGDGSSYAGVVAGANLGIIDNCNVSNSKVSGNNAGAITGNNSVQVNNCNVQDVTINGNYLAGGISAYNYGKIEYCTVSGDNTQIKATGSSSRAGGIVASNSEENNVSTSGRLLKCAVEKANISGVWAGGIAGENAFGTVAQCVVYRSVIIHESGQNSTRLGGVVGYNARGEVVASYSAYTTVGAQDLNSEAMGGIVGYNYSSSAYVYGCYSTHVSLLGNAGNNIGAIAGYNNGHVTSCYAVLPENVSDINLVGNNIATSGIDHCVEVGGNNYTELENASDLTVTDGTVWKAAEIWEITASGATPTINVNYIGEAGTN
ncbi:Uncharacterised protein [uncultured Bacteroides sp.]|uniref:fimbrillin family protein n=1 Tax=Bacteroides cellulolyticus TaxID=2981780 RepID=UPI0008217BAE|nr:fimbrillin family protein [Bacteroides cellulolyticus]MCU6770710.1 fimbrillin family protein [Bacteroides cellulolyticus]SCH25822.1 Uncharacterised protein [uncultured Bacteroides sp.]